MAQNELIQEVLSKATNRRRMLKRLVTASAALGAVAATGLEAQTAPAGPTAVDVLQFALQLEYLEAEFYSIATSGLTLSQRGVGVTGAGVAGATTSVYLTSAATTSNPVPAVAFGPGGFYPALNIAQDEINHVVLLRTALTGAGITPVAKPALNLDALASVGASLANQSTFLSLARIFEDIGVSAYAGGAAILAGTPYLTTAARILAVEGEHTGNIRLQIARLGITAPSLSAFGDLADVVPPSTVNVNTTLNAVVPTAATFYNSPNFFTSGAFFSTSPTTGLTAVRTPAQVLYLAYGAANATSGGFFPAGFNGNINTSGSPATATALNGLV